MSGNFFAQSFHSPQGNRDQMQQKGQRIHPECPHRLQRPGEKSEKYRGTACQPQQQQQAHLPPGPIEREEEHRRPGQDAVQDVQHPCQPAQPQAEGPQHIVQQAQRHPQQTGLQADQQPQRNIGAHGGSPEQPAEESPLFLAALLIGDGVDPAVHVELAPVQGKLADV